MQEQAVYGYEFEGTRYDCGTTMGWLKASVELALQRPELAPEFRTLPPGARALAGSRARPRAGHEADAVAVSPTSDERRRASQADSGHPGVACCGSGPTLGGGTDAPAPDS